MKAIPIMSNDTDSEEDPNDTVTTHQSLGEISEVNVSVDDGDDGWVRVVLVGKDGDSISALVPKDIAEGGFPDEGSGRIRGFNGDE